MAKLKSPLFSFSADGRFSKSLVYKETSAGHTVKSRAQVIQPQTISQQFRQWLYQDAIYQWYLLSAGQRESYQVSARALHMPGTALFIKDYLSAWPDSNVLFYWSPPQLHGDVLWSEDLAHHSGTLFGARYVKLPSKLPVIAFTTPGDYVDYGSGISFSFGTSQFVLECWFIDFKTSDASTIASKGYHLAGYNGNWILRVNPTNGLEFYIFDGLVPRLTTFKWPGYVAIRNNWNYIRIVRYASGYLSMEVNSVEVATASYSGNIGLNSASLFLGKNPDSAAEYALGQISLCNGRLKSSHRSYYDSQYHLFVE